MYSRKIFGLALAVMASVSGAALAESLQVDGTTEFREMIRESKELTEFFQRYPTIYNKVLADTSLQQQMVDGDLTTDELLAMENGKTDSPGFDRAAANDINSVIDAPAPTPIVILPDGTITHGTPGNGKPTTGAGTPGGDTTKPVDSSGVDSIKLTPGNGHPTTGNGRPGGGTATPPAAVERVDLNAPIDATKAALDRGWPRYLKVPANCPAADDNKHYYFNFRHDKGNSGFGGGSLDVYDGKFIAPWEGLKGGNTKYMNSTDSEIHAIPLNYPPEKMGTYMLELISDIAPTLSNGDLWRASVSSCPGTFGTEPGVLTSGGEGGLGDLGMLVMVMDGKPVVYSPTHSVPTMEAGKRYYLNLKTSGECNALAATAPADGSFPITRRTVKGRSEAVCAGLITPGYSNKGPERPYAGPCLSQGPYPENYNSYYCQGSTWGAENTSPSAITIMRWRCNDVRDKHGPTNFEVRKINGQWSWTLGANKAVYQDTVCARDIYWPGRTEPIKSWDELDPLAAQQ